MFVVDPCYLLKVVFSFQSVQVSVDYNSRQEWRGATARIVSVMEHPTDHGGSEDVEVSSDDERTPLNGAIALRQDC